MERDQFPSTQWFHFQFNDPIRGQQHSMEHGRELEILETNSRERVEIEQVSNLDFEVIKKAITSGNLLLLSLYPSNDFEILV
ncbi:hypothetical protein ABKV19_027096 [Rosa sericea]